MAIVQGQAGGIPGVQEPAWGPRGQARRGAGVSYGAGRESQRAPAACRELASTQAPGLPPPCLLEPQMVCVH